MGTYASGTYGSGTYADLAVVADPANIVARGAFGDKVQVFSYLTRASVVVRGTTQAKVQTLGWVAAKTNVTGGIQ